jgi:hypothetical protein
MRIPSSVNPEPPPRYRRSDSPKSTATGHPSRLARWWSLLSAVLSERPAGGERAPICDALGLRSFPGQVDHSGGQVDSCHFGAIDSEMDRNDSGPASNIDHSVGGTHSSNLTQGPQNIVVCDHLSNRERISLKSELLRRRGLNRTRAGLNSTRLRRIRLAVLRSLTHPRTIAHRPGSPLRSHSKPTATAARRCREDCGAVAGLAEWRARRVSMRHRTTLVRWLAADGAEQYCASS